MQRSETVGGVAVRIDEPDDRPPAGCVLLLHGWPDSAALWDGTVAALSPRWRCVRFTLPGFAPGDAAGARTLEQITELTRQVVQAVGGASPVTLVLHDWGCLFGYHFARRYPALVDRIVGVDVGDAGSRAHRTELDWRARLGILRYQGWLALAWRIGGRLGDRMARWMAARLRAPTPLPQVRAQMGYPYWIAWTGTHGSYRAARPWRPGEPGLPMLYVYGRRKPFMFHSRAWCQALAARADCRVVGMATGHWAMLDAPAEFHAAVAGWLNACAASAPPPAA